MSNDANFGNVTLKLAWSLYEPARFGCSYESKLDTAPECRYPGWNAEVVASIMRAAGLNYSLVAVPQGPGFVRRLYSMLENGQVDGCAMLFSATKQRLQRFASSVQFPTVERVVALFVKQRSQVKYIILRIKRVQQEDCVICLF